jgi:hypothetical protein
MQFVFGGCHLFKGCFRILKKIARKSSVFGLGSPDLECLLLQAAKQQKDYKKLKK